jgi:D-3-phosphoglycerate dehydrogenase / 2-oxoglutarate reductase
VSFRRRIVVTDNDPPFFSGPDDPDLTPLKPLGEVVLNSSRSGSRDEFLRRLESAHALIYLRKPSPLDAAAFAAAPDLRVVCVPGVGVDGVDLAAARERNVTVCNLPGANAPAVAEHTIGLLLAVARHLTAADESMREGFWRKREGVELGGRTLGVLGLGAIGSRVVRLGQGFGMAVVAWSLHRDEDRARRLEVELVDLDELFRRSDVVSVHLRSTAESAGIVGASRLSLMPRGSLLINTARAAILDSTAVVEALRTGQLGGLGVDVFPSEPATAENNPYLGLDNVVMTPHMADETRETNARMRRLVVENIVAFLRDQPQNVVV